MTIHLISVGISLEEALREGRLREHNRTLDRAVAREEPWTLLGTDNAAAHEWLSRTLAGDQRDPARFGRLQTMAERIRPEQWPSSLSAELSTLARDPQARLPLSSTDVAVLLSSDTAEGLTTGLWIAVALVGGALHRIHYLADPDHLISDVHDRVVLARIPGMDAGDERGFNDAMHAVGVLGRRLRERVAADGEPIRCHLSGGFKAAIPYLIGLAEGLRSLGGTGQVDAVVLHERTQGGLIRLPLRRMAPGRVAQELSGFRDGVRAEKPESDFLEGYAWEEEKDRKRWRLTPFGRGLHALFDLEREDEGLGG